MKNETKNLATYKEFGKMLREVANVYAALGEEPLPTTDEEQEKEYTSITREVERISPVDCAGLFNVLRNTFARYPIDVDKAKKWSRYLNQCEERGTEPDYENWENKLTAL